jgi:hypothetical protein
MSSIEDGVCEGTQKLGALLGDLRVVGNGLGGLEYFELQCIRLPAHLDKGPFNLFIVWKRIGVRGDDMNGRCKR